MNTTTMNESVDFIAIGSGSGSLCAAIKLQAAGKRVLVLEKTELLGGTTATSGGVMWIPNNRFMKNEGINDSSALANSYLDAVVGDHSDTPGATRERRHRYVEESAQTIEFLIKQGLKFRRIPSWPDYHKAPGESLAGRTVISELFDLNRLGEWKDKLRPGFLPLPAYIEEAMELPNIKRSWSSIKILFRIIGRAIKARLQGKNLSTAGHALQGQLLHAAIKAGADIRINAGVKQLLVEDGRVIGVTITKDNQQWRIGARCGVLINAGGFAQNQRMLDQYIPGANCAWSNACKGDTGEMIEAGMDIGAAVAQMDQRVGSPVAIPPENPNIKPPMQGDLSKPHAILVDQNGRRYMREASSYSAISQNILNHNKNTPASPSWMILDSQYLGKYMLAGSMPGKKKPKAWLEKNFLRTANSLAELATICGINSTTLETTVTRFNQFVLDGQDQDFGRGNHIYDNWLGDSLHSPSQTLGSIEKAPFYALPIYPGDLGTYGGLVTDQYARVLRQDGSVIDGLYATGTSTASVMGKGCPGAGASIGPAITWGYVAAKQVLNEDSNPN